jgi:hypothetical protein
VGGEGLASDCWSALQLLRHLVHPYVQYALGRKHIDRHLSPVQLAEEFNCQQMHMLFFPCYRHCSGISACPCPCPCCPSQRCCCTTPTTTTTTQCWWCWCRWCRRPELQHQLDQLVSCGGDGTNCTACRTGLHQVQIQHMHRDLLPFERIVHSLFPLQYLPDRRCAWQRESERACARERERERERERARERERGGGGQERRVSRGLCLWGRYRAPTLQCTARTDACTCVVWCTVHGSDRLRACQQRLWWLC